MEKYFNQEDLQIGQRFNPYKLFNGIFIPDDIVKCSVLNSTDKLCWGRLYKYSGKNGVCYPKQKTLAEEIGVSEQVILRSLKNLENNKFIEVERPKGKDRILHKSSRYFFIWNDYFNSSETIMDNSPGAINFNSSETITDNSPLYISKENHIKENQKEKEENDFFKKENKKPLLRVTQQVKDFIIDLLSNQQERFPNSFKKKDLPKRIDDGCQFIMKLKKEYDFDSIIIPVLTWAMDSDFWSKNIFSLSALKKRTDKGGPTKFEKILRQWESASKSKSYKPVTEEDRLKNEKSIAWHI
jgi:DNA-binding Lrp family transcriptional regulator